MVALCRQGLGISVKMCDGRKGEFRISSTVGRRLLLGIDVSMIKIC